MGSKTSEEMVGSISSAYSKQFTRDLDLSLLSSVVEKEIRRKSEAFLQAHLVLSDIDIEGLYTLRSYLKNLKKFKNPKKESSQGSLEVVGRAVLPADGEELDEEELRKEKRRAYARAYYQRRKSGEGKEEREFKTPPEQRSYQRNYYHRKKIENLIVSEQQEAIGSKSASSLTLEQEVASEDLNNNGDEVDYGSLAKDRMAIENAFRPEEVTAPKTKLRKAKRN